MEDTNLLSSWLKEAANLEASDLFISVGEPPTVKIYGVFKKLTDQVLDAQTVENFVKHLLPENKFKEFSEGKDREVGVDTASFVDGLRSALR